MVTIHRCASKERTVSHQRDHRDAILLMQPQGVAVGCPRGSHLLCMLDMHLPVHGFRMCLCTSEPHPPTRMWKRLVEACSALGYSLQVAGMSRLGEGVCSGQAVVSHKCSMWSPVARNSGCGLSPSCLLHCVHRIP